MKKKQPALAPPQVEAWFDRKFASVPAVGFPNVCVRLRGTPARLKEMLRGVSRDVLIRKPDGKWSAQEHAGHLLDLEPLWLARVEDYIAGRDELTVADITNRRTTEANHNAAALEEILAKFRAVRGDLLKRLDELDPAVFSRSAIHPRLKQPMRLVDHLYFLAEHDDHHLAKIWEMIR